MIVSPVAYPARLAARTARPSKSRGLAGPPGPTFDVAALMRRALVRNELLLAIAAAPRPSGSPAR